MIDARRIPQIQAAARSVPGVASALVRVSDPRGPAQLELTLTADADETKVTREVIELLRSVGGADAGDLQVQRPVPGITAARPVFLALSVDRGPLDARVRVQLAVPGGQVTGSAHGLLAAGAEARLAAVATADALTAAYSPAGRFEIVSVEPGSHPGRVDVIVRTVSPGGPAVDLLGAALDPGDTRVAAVRAALDAVNRRLVPVARALSAA